MRRRGTEAVMQNGHLTQTTEKRLMIVSGQGYPELAEKITDRLDMDLSGVELVKFPGGELYARYLESVRGADMFIIQSLCEPVNENLMQLLIMIDAAKRASAKRIVAVIPWYAYSRQDRKTKPREPITARLIANMIQAAGAERVMTMDLHTGQIEGYFTFPVDHLTAMHTFVDYFVEQGFKDADDAVVVAPDTGEVKVAKQLAGHLRLPWAIVNKMRDRPDRSEVTHVIGDVAGKRVVMIDDIIATGGTLVNAAERLIKDGATEVWAAATHGEFSGDAYRKIENSRIKEVVVTDTLPLKSDQPRSKIKTLTIAPILASTIKNVFTDESVSEVFMGENQLF
jgi:ribose-phosphate pyrophosphokinase